MWAGGGGQRGRRPPCRQLGFHDLHAERQACALFSTCKEDCCWARIRVMHCATAIKVTCRPCATIPSLPAALSRLTGGHWTLHFMFAERQPTIVVK